MRNGMGVGMVVGKGAGRRVDGDMSGGCREEERWPREKPKEGARSMCMRARRGVQERRLRKGGTQERFVEGRGDRALWSV